MKIIRASTDYPALILSDGAGYFYNADNVRVCNGSRMGRHSTRSEDIPDDTPLYIQRLNWDGDYDEGGAYWGRANRALESIFCAYSEDGEVHIFKRAISMSSVVEWLSVNYPACKVIPGIDRMPSLLLEYDKLDN